ncbi:MAG: polymer-forming cytoskeletal protein [Nitrospirota bacterium]|nr:polymer-forming cytoskeletal protein [Nitrospirota bacterium]
MWGEKPKRRETIFDEQHYTFLGKGVDFKGTAQFEGTVRVDGRFEGEMHTDDTLIIGEHAIIKGNVSGNVVVSGGKVQGNITAFQRVQLFNPAVVIGDIRTPNFSMEEGVSFQGMCDMGVTNLEQLDTKRPEPAEERNGHAPAHQFSKNGQSTDENEWEAKHLAQL